MSINNTEYINKYKIKYTNGGFSRTVTVAEEVVQITNEGQVDETITSYFRNVLNLSQLTTTKTGTKINPEKAVTPYPLHITDKKSNCILNVENHGNGQYKVSAAEPVVGIEKRTATVARGLQKLGELVGSNTDANSIDFPCKQSHDALIAILLVRAPNVRAAIREADELANRGQLIAPSAQK